MARIDVLCDQLGISIVKRSRRCRPRETRARRALTKLAESQGDGHVVFVLRTIVQSANNKASLWSETILAVSDVVRLRPDLSDRGGAFMEAFDRISLEEVRARARRMGIGPKRQVMRVLITDRLESELDPPAQRRLL
ncbi:hypothetical protein [Methylopila sp. Yamaguchi]|uniref:hypothetical protein n=1 Tax=Methylopila sp. Yamaguchi TaxID=1437817 RepID=UPI000CB54677|nr:hypothetical protein [Methylopila sp. Yamaguchi]GBD48080.1 hypothetical protein METY_1293 [Methylopila sp. Yamaguchi]